jgi:TRAP-type transport system small permease protein
MVRENTGTKDATAAAASPWQKNSSNIKTAIHRLCQVMNILGMTVLVLLTCMTVVDVLGRYILKMPLIGTAELTEYMMVIITFMCIGWCAIKGRMVVVDLLLSHFPNKVQATLNVITLFIGLGIMVMFTWRNFLEAIALSETTKNSPMLHIPVYPFMWILTAGFGVLCLAMIVLLAQNVSKVAKK